MNYLTGSLNNSSISFFVEGSTLWDVTLCFRASISEDPSVWSSWSSGTRRKHNVCVRVCDMWVWIENRVVPSKTSYPRTFQSSDKILKTGINGQHHNFVFFVYLGYAPVKQHLSSAQVTFCHRLYIIGC